jgi:hypothetical protein
VTVPQLDQSSGARARRRARHDDLLRQQMREGVVLGAFVAVVVIITLGAIGRAQGWW